MPKTKKKKGFKNQCFNAWHTEWNSSSDKLVDVAGIGGFTNIIEAFKEIGKQKLSKAIEYRNTTKICVDCLQSSLKKRNFTALLGESDLLRLQNKVRFLAKINYLCLLIELPFHHYQSSDESNLSFEKNVIICSFFFILNRFKHE